LCGNNEYLARIGHFKISKYEVGVLAILVLATLLRVLLITYSWPRTESDEGVIDLMALHIAYRGEHPIFIYGQGYLGSLEAYLGALLFHLFGVSVFTVRLGLVLLFVLFLVSMYLLVSLLYSKKLAMTSLLLLSLGSSSILNREVEGLGGRPENLLFGSLMVLLASWLALSYRPSLSRREQLVRQAGYGCLGLVIGLGLWSDLLILPFVVMVIVFLALFCWREICTWATLCLVGGCIVGALPLIAYNITAPPGKDTWTEIQWVRHGPASFSSFHLSLVHGIKVTILETLPHATGAYPLCPVEISPLPEHLGPQGQACIIMYDGWGLGWIALWTSAVLLAALALWKFWSRSRTQKLSVEERHAAVHHAARLMLLASAGLTLALCALSPQTAVLPFRSVRYLTPLLIATPALIWPLWCVVSRGRLLPLRGTSIKVVFSQSVLLLIGITLLSGTISTFGEIPAAQDANLQQARLIQDLMRIHATHIYSDYQTCYRLIFATNEQIICASLEGSELNPFNKYPRYGTIVTHDAHAVYVFPLNSPQATAFARKVAMSKRHYHHFELDNYVVYRPS
jgi:hypothetical protein